MSFPTAGPDDDLREEHATRMVEERTTTGQRHFADALVLLRRRPPERKEAERLARLGLERYARALDWAEDGPREEEYHQRLDSAGKWVRTTFGCHLKQVGTSYFETCPVALAHNRVGMSIGGTATRWCSLCGADLSECEHEKGITYLVPGGKSDLGWCRVCLRTEGACEHLPTKEYRARVVGIVRDIELDEISFVDKPAQPEARLTSVGVDPQKLQAALGPEFKLGMPVSCDKCLQPCPGLTRPHFSQD